MQINREWERTVASNWSGFIGALSVSKSISFGHLLWLRFSISCSLFPFLSAQSPALVLSFPLSPRTDTSLPLPLTLQTSVVSSVFSLLLLNIYVYYVYMYTQDSTVINQELVPSGHFSEVVDAYERFKNIAATAM